MPKCYFCNKVGIEKRSLTVDVEPDVDIDEQGNEIWYSHNIKADEWLCQEHLEAYDNGELEVEGE